MKFIKWKILVITSVVCLLPIIMGIAVWDKLPDTMAIHFNINNVADSFAPKSLVLLGLPVMMMFFQIFCCVANDINAHKHGRSIKFGMVSKWIVPIMTIVLQTTIIGYGLSWNPDVRKIATFLAGVIFISLGICIPKLDYVKNMELDTQRARKINKFTGISMVIMGVLSLVSMFLPPIFAVVWVILIILYSVVCIVYAMVVARK